MKKIAGLLFGLISWWCTQPAIAHSIENQCIATFPSAIQSTATSGNGNISFSCGSQVITNSEPTDLLPTKSLSNPSKCGTKTCPSSVNCSATRTAGSRLNAGSFETSTEENGDFDVAEKDTGTIEYNDKKTTDYGTVTVNSNATLNFTANPSGETVYHISTLKLKDGASVNFVGGDYWIGSITTEGGQAKIITTKGTTRLFIKNNVAITKGLDWNTSGSASQFLIYGYGNISITSSASTINAILYAQGNITLGNVDLTGSVTGNKVTLNSSSTVTYDSNAVNDLDFGFICPAPSTSQFAVSAPSTGTNCSNMTITVTAQNSLGQTVTNYTGTVTLNTQTGSGTWVSTTGGGSLSNLGSGQAVYNFVAGDYGAASFQLSYPASGSSPMTVETFQTNNSSIVGYSGAVNFVPTGLLVTDTAVSTPPASPPPAFSTTKTAGSPFTLYLTAYNPSNCGIVTSYTGAKTIRFYTTYVNPTSGTMNATINGTAIASSSGATVTTQSINFTNGVATITVQYNDAGKLSLNVIDTAVSPAGPTGASGNFVVKPASFVVNIPNNTASQTQTAAACLGNTVFSKAGNNFTVNVQPRNALGNVTPNYGNETSPQGITLTSGAVYGPTNARNGSANTGVIGNGSTFTKITSGAVPAGSGWSLPYFQGTTFSFDEVGCINLTIGVSGANYLGATNGAVSGPAVLVVGRFTPDHFDVSGNTPQFKTACTGGSGSFTYLDQPFLYTSGSPPVMTVIARALAGTTTQNYTGTAAGANFWKLTSAAFGSLYKNVFYPVNAGDAIPALTLVATIPAPTFVDVGGGNAAAIGAGTGTFTFSDNGGLKIQRFSGTMSPAFTAELQLSIPAINDSDTVACTGTGCVSGGFSFGATTVGNGIGFSGTGGGKQFYHGRLVILNSNGPENLPLTMPMQTQYYTTAGGFVLNSLDSGASGTCTAYTGGVTNLVVSPSTGLSTTATVAGSPNYYFVQGVLNITLLAPTGTTTGYADVEANIAAGGANLPWLQFNWPYSGSPVTNFSQDPRGRGNFGIYPGNSRIIYQKELTQ